MVKELLEREEKNQERTESQKPRKGKISRRAWLMVSQEVHWLMRLKMVHRF